MVRRLVSTLLAVGLAACGGSQSLPQPGAIARVTSSDGQTAPAGSRVPAPLAVTVTSSAGATVTGGQVLWTVVAGDGAVLSDTLTVSDGTGTAVVWLTLGPTPGSYSVRATLAAVPSQSVILQATASPPPVVASVAPTTFTGRDTITITGQDLTETTSVEVGGVASPPLTVSATQVTALVPVCLVPGPVQLRVRIGEAKSGSITATYQAASAPLVLAAGDYASVDPAQLAGCATFPDAGPSGAEYLLAPQSVTNAPGQSVAFRLAGDTTTTTAPAPRVARTPLPFAARFDALLRRQEERIAATPRPPAGPTPLAAPTLEVISVGNQRTFEVCKSLPCGAVTDFTSVKATAKYVGNHAAIYIDDQAPAGGFTQADFDSLGALFDQHLYEVDTRAFGAESDIDHNGVVIILFTPAVNGLTPSSQCSTSIISGFFYGIDIDPAYANDSRSNHAEIFYAVAPDPDGTASCAITVQQVRNLVPVTFEHEFQHMISYNQHVLIRHGPPEVLWLNEGLSHLAEELGGLHFEAIGRKDLFSQFTIRDLYNAGLFLHAPGATFVLPASGTGTLEERGASWLFLRWVVDHFGSDVTRRLDETSLTGAENVANATTEPFSRLLSEWFLANWASDLPGLTAPPRLRYTTWDFRTTYASLHQQDPNHFPYAFPLDPLVFSGGSFGLSDTLRAGSGYYLRVIQDSSSVGFTAQLTAPDGSPISGTGVPRLDILRIR